MLLYSIGALSPSERESVCLGGKGTARASRRLGYMS